MRCGTKTPRRQSHARIKGPERGKLLMDIQPCGADAQAIASVRLRDQMLGRLAAALGADLLRELFATLWARICSASC